MAVNTQTEAQLARALCSPDLAKDLVSAVNTAVSSAGVVSLGGVSGAITASAGRTALGLGTVAVGTVATVIAALAATTDITAVPGSFADAAAVQSYLAGANVIPNIETRLDNLESKINAVIAALKAGNLMASS